MSTVNKVAIIADWLIDFGGAELVLSHLLEMFPDADIYTSVCYMEHPMLKGRRVYTSWLQRVPFFNRRHKLAGILRPWAFRSFDLSGYDVIISSSSAESKNAKGRKWTNGKGPIHICYCHTPIRYYWSHYEEYRNMMEFGWLNPIARLTLDTLVGWLRKLDYEAVQKVDYFIANSENTAKRIKKYYNRESEVIYPGVDSFTEGQNNRITEYNKICETVNLGNCKSDYYLGIGRCIPYKKFDLLVDAFNANGKPLILVTNTDNLLYRKLLARSSPNITWRLNISRAERNELYAKARAFLFPPEEDFGLVPIEAMTSGTPVIAYGKGGAVETIVDGETGVFFTPQTPEALNEAIERFEKMRWDREKIRERAEEFSKERFQERILEFIKNHD